MDNLEYNYKLLKDTRLAKNISPENMAFDLCLAERQIHSIENNLPNHFYSPAIKLTCIKKYAEKLGLDIREVLYQSEGAATHKNKNQVATKEASLTVDSPVPSEYATRKPQETYPTKNQASHVIIDLTLAYIENNLSNKITMDDLIKLSGYSERSIQLVFQSRLNQSPFEYIEEQRLLRARALIEAHKQSKKIADIAQDVGMFHLGRFSINFKKRFGISPSVLARS